MAHSREADADMKKTFGRGMKRVREAQGMKQESLARQAGYMDHSNIAKIEAGKMIPSLAKAFVLADVLQVSLEAILRTGRGAPLPPEIVPPPLREVLVNHFQHGLTQVANGLQEIARVGPLIGADFPDAIPLKEAQWSDSPSSQREDSFFHHFQLLCGDVVGVAA